MWNYPGRRSSHATRCSSPAHERTREFPWMISSSAWLRIWAQPRNPCQPRNSASASTCSTGIFTLAGGSWAARDKLGPWANLRCRCARFVTNPPAGKTVRCVKAPFRPLATVPLPLTNSALCKNQVVTAARGSATLRCSKTVPCVKAAWLIHCALRTPSLDFHMMTHVLIQNWDKCSVSPTLQLHLPLPLPCLLRVFKEV